MKLYSVVCFRIPLMRNLETHHTCMQLRVWLLSDPLLRDLYVTHEVELLRVILFDMPVNVGGWNCSWSQACMQAQIWFVVKPEYAALDVGVLHFRLGQRFDSFHIAQKRRGYSSDAMFSNQCV